MKYCLHYLYRPLAKKLSVGVNVWPLNDVSLFNVPQEVPRMTSPLCLATGSCQVKIFYRLEVNSQHFCSERYGRVKKR